MNVRRIVLDVDKAGDRPSIPDIAAAITACAGVEACNITVQEIDVETVGMNVTIEGTGLEYEKIRAAIERCGPISTHPLMIPPVAWVFGRHLDDLQWQGDRTGTFLIGRNIARAEELPTLPRGIAVREVTRTTQIRVVQTCGAK